MKNIKVMMVGSGEYEIYEKAFFNAFQKLNIECRLFPWGKYLKGNIFKKIQNKFLIGPVFKKIKAEFLEQIELFKPDLLFLYKPYVFSNKTLRSVKDLGIKIFAYNNDDPFSKLSFNKINKQYINSLNFCDWIFAYRHKNIMDYKNLGFNNVSLLKPYYIKDRNFAIANIRENKYSHEVVFIGHFENDGRDEYVKCLIECGEVDFYLYGTFWERSRYAKDIRLRFGSIKRLNGENYNLAINQTKIALVFLSKLNNDVYTRRCFEIPAAKTFMLCEYTKEMDEMFKEGVEAEYFRNKDEMIDKIKYYLKHTDERERIAQAGYERLLKDGYEVTDRVNEVMRIYEKLQS